MKKRLKNIITFPDVQETEHEERVENRISVIFVILGLLLLVLILILVFNSGAAGLSSRAVILQEYAIQYQNDITILAGDIYDRDGTLLSWSEWVSSDTEEEADAEATEDAEETLESRVYDRSSVRYYIDGNAYSQLLGYTGRSVLKYSDEVYAGRDDYRLMRLYAEELYTPVTIDGTKGESLTLTLDHELQMTVYDLLLDVMGTDDTGSAVVLDAKTGEILSMVSFPTFDLNDLSEAKAEMSGEDYYPVTYKGSVAPGSIFKIITAVSLIDHGLEDLVVTDAAFEVDNWICQNAYTSAGDEITYYEGIERSSNVFFGTAALTLGTEALNETAEKFMLNTEEDYIELDLGYVATNWDTDNLTDAELAQTGFGQGRTEFTTLYAAMVAQTIANDGTMLKPYLIKSISDANGKVLSEGGTEVLSEVTSKSTANKVTEAMLAVMTYNRENGSALNNDEDWRIISQYQVAGKTGTAERGDDTNNAWFISFAPADDPQYVVVVNQCGVQKYGSSMIHTAAQIYKYLFEGAE